MTREVIAREGLPTVLPGIWLAKDSLKTTLDRIPLVYSFAYEDQVGWATDMQRDDKTGEVSVEVSFFDKLHSIDRKLMRATFAAKDVESRQVPATEDLPEYKLITSANIIWVSICPIETLIDIS